MTKLVLSTGYVASPPYPPNWFIPTYPAHLSTAACLQAQCKIQGSIRKVGSR